MEEIGSKIKSKAETSKRLTGLSFCVAYTIQEDPAESVHFASPESSLS